MTTPPEIDLTAAQQLAEHYTQITTTEGMWLTKYDDDMIYKMAALFPALLTRVRDLEQQIITLQQDARQADMDCDQAISLAHHQALHYAADDARKRYGFTELNGFLIEHWLRARAENPQ